MKCGWETLTAGLFTCGNLGGSQYGHEKGFLIGIQTQLFEIGIEVGLFYILHALMISREEGINV